MVNAITFVRKEKSVLKEFVIPHAPQVRLSVIKPVTISRTPVNTADNVIIFVKLVKFVKAVSVLSLALLDKLFAIILVSIHKTIVIIVANVAMLVVQEKSVLMVTAN